MLPRTLLVISACALCFSVGASEPRIAKWRGDATAALSLTFDDSLPSHWSVAVPALNEKGMRATFFVITGSTDWESARLAALAGHEIGSHSTTDAKLVTPAPRPHQLVAGAENIIQLARQTIETEIGQVVPGYRALSFAYPYGITSLESDDTHLPDLVARYHWAARTAGVMPVTITGIRVNGPTVGTEPGASPAPEPTSRFGLLLDQSQSRPQRNRS
ncbi:MAG: polysaccharide deacetylase family protein [Verrucomicrobia bacterium]|nr:polysaccharide deacetylase family protein [Verrucomicrobiota bacterium]